MCLILIVDFWTLWTPTIGSFAYPWPSIFIFSDQIALLKQSMPINRHLWFLITPIFIRSHFPRKKRTQKVFSLMGEYSFFGIPSFNRQLRRGQRTIRGGLLVIVPFALRRPLESVVERAKGSTKWETGGRLWWKSMRPRMWSSKRIP